MTTVRESIAAALAASPPSARHSELIAVTATSLDELMPLREDWLRLYSRQPIVTPWPHPDRYCAELRVPKADVAPHVTRFRGAAGQCGMVVGRTVTTRLPCQVGYLKVDTPRVRLLHVVHGGLLTDGTAEVRLAILDHLQGLLRRRSVDLISINHLPQEHECYADLRRAGAVAQPSERHWLLRLEGSYEDLLGASPRSTATTSGEWTGFWRTILAGR